MTQFKGHQGEADYEIVDLGNGRAVVIRSKRGRVTETFAVEREAASEYVRFQRSMDRDGYATDMRREEHGRWK
jgi:hypothetical protein